MNYIVLDLEWNQPLTEQDTITDPFPFDSEIIEIGAVKLDENFAAVEEFKATLEFAIEQARTEGALHALETAALLAEAESNRYSSTWGEGSAGDKALLNVAREIRARKGEQ